jgi:hypothetical protein
MRNSLSGCGKQDQPDLHLRDSAATDWEEIPDGLRTRYLFGAAPDDLAGLDHSTQPATLAAGGKRRCDGKRNDMAAERLTSQCDGRHTLPSHLRRCE